MVLFVGPLQVVHANAHLKTKGSAASGHFLFKITVTKCSARPNGLSIQQQLQVGVMFIRTTPSSPSPPVPGEAVNADLKKKVSVLTRFPFKITVTKCSARPNVLNIQQQLRVGVMTIKTTTSSSPPPSPGEPVNADLKKKVSVLTRFPFKITVTKCSARPNVLSIQQQQRVGVMIIRMTSSSPGEAVNADLKKTAPLYQCVSCSKSQYQSD